MVGNHLSSQTTGWGMPRQKLPLSQKGKSWKEECVRTITSYGFSRTLNGRTTKEEKQLNYNIKNGGFEAQDFEYVTDSFGIGNQFGGNPAQLVMKNLVGPKIDRLKGEEMRRPFAWMARGSSGPVITARQQEKQRLIGEYLQAMYTNIQGGGGGTEQELQGQGVQLPPSIEKYMRSEYLDPREVTANQILHYLIKKDGLAMKFNMNFEDALISAEQIGYSGIVNGHPSYRVTNPLCFDYPHNEETKWIQDAEWGREEQWLMPGQVLDLYGEFLNEEQLSQLDENQLGAYFQGTNNSPFDLYSPAINALRPAGGILVQTVAWRSWKKVVFLNYTDPKTGEWQKTEVDEDFTLRKEEKAQGWTLDTSWDVDVWRGTRIGQDIYVDIRSTGKKKLPWTGYVHNNRNAKAASLIDLCKADQYTYMIVWWKLEMELARHKGKRMVYDTSMLPTTGPNAMSMDQFIYYGESLGVVFYNSKAGSDGRPGSGNAGGNMFQEVNLSGDGSYLQALLTVLGKIEERIDALTGVSRQREGDVRASESATGVENAVSQSSLITEPWFYFHNEFKGHVLTTLVDLAKEAYKDGTTLPVVVDEAYQTLLKVDGDTFPDSEYGVFITNSSKDWADMQKLESYAQAALQKGILPFSAIVGMVNAQSISEVQDIIAQAEKQAQQQASQSAQAQQQHEQQVEAMKAQTMQAQWNNENGQKELDRQNKIQVATITSLKGKDGPSDVDGDGIADPIQQAELALKMSAHNASLVASQHKQSADLQKTGLAHQATMRKLDLETTKLGIEASKANLQQAQFTREQDQQDHTTKLETAQHKADTTTKAKELSLKEKELAQKAGEAKLKAQLEKAKLQQEAKEASLQRAHEHSLQDKKGKVEIAKVKLKPKPKPASGK